MTRWVLRIIAANAVMFLLTSASPELERQLMFVPALALLRPWTAVTYMFLHANVGHILFNMLALFFFGPRLEAEIGEKRFLWLYFISGLSGAALSVLFAPQAAIVGASAAVYGVFIGFTYFWPRAMIYIWGIFPVEARWLVAGMTALSLFGGFSGDGGGIAHFAHLGGFLGGFLYLRAVYPRRLAAPAQSRTEKPTIDPGAVKRWKGIDAGSMHEINREEYQRIMMKLDSEGNGSLTPEEIGFLERFSRR
ncbi:MAG TPA: rhomboid family intramembrane serine protease [Bacteroidota bacterium]|nr:rhomboid family intramembrane serine protease [Bacteroidota bacterium]